MSHNKCECGAKNGWVAKTANQWITHFVIMDYVIWEIATSAVSIGILNRKRLLSNKGEEEFWDAEFESRSNISRCGMCHRRKIAVLRRRQSQSQSDIQIRTGAEARRDPIGLINKIRLLTPGMLHLTSQKNTTSILSYSIRQRKHAKNSTNFRVS